MYRVLLASLLCIAYPVEAQMVADDWSRLRNYAQRFGSAYCQHLIAHDSLAGKLIALIEYLSRSRGSGAQ